MQGTRIRLIVGGLLLAAASSNVQAEALQPDPAWQQGKLENGFSWQLLATPQRPSDRVELRLVVNTGSLSESAQHVGFAHLLPRLALMSSASFTPAQLQSLWQQGVDNDRPLPPAITSYDFTLYSLSLPNNRPDLMKEALAWLSDTSGKLAISEQTVNAALNSATDPIATFPQNIQEPWWRYRLKGSSLMGHDPGQPVAKPVDIEKLKQFYQQWYTPDAMTLYVVGNVDSRSIAAQIGKTFSELKGKRTTPAPIAMLAPLPSEPVSLMSEQATQDTLSLMWDTPWHPIQDSVALSRYWRSDLAREALFWHVQQVLEKSDQKNLKLGFDCRVQYQRAQCAIHLNTPTENLTPGMSFVARELASLRTNGLSQAEFDALMVQKNDQLSKLFATYARTDTDILMSQRLRSQQSGVVDIAPEQYQKLRQAFLSGLTLAELNQELKQQLSQDTTLILTQPKGEPEVNVKALQDAYNAIMTPHTVVPEDAAPTVASAEAAPATPTTAQ
ncbi:TPA: insulinase family protein [Yersinia enterocolitica]|uniref:M16 family metallopeptidase n=1 Tax=Yersinia enterocolitica TaxID=630 RepID=UPI00227C48D4|nr:pitrilysin family protein [Yersinia enterocolitica]EKN3982296.1 insulinase family protein [Yersinia enterocolitica]EKN3987158.1 insulinase family protein [Yersinia enterocolitica]EKN5943403.1 insulinase family protein [Yersinia enterocolitica]EKN6221810.1 insulinase family protein [Yersinia enterocolitica]ELI8046156.1 insulinase family protein [Yersinia enterocolitica]